MNKTATADELKLIGIETPYVDKIFKITKAYPTLMLKKPFNLPHRDFPGGRIISSAYMAGSEFQVTGTENGQREPILVIAKDGRGRELVLLPEGHIARLMEFGPPELLKSVFEGINVGKKRKAQVKEPSDLEMMMEIRRNQAVVRL